MFTVGLLRAGVTKNLVGGKIGPAGPILATKSGPAGPKMTPKFVRLIQNWSGHINTLILCENGLFK